MAEYIEREVLLEHACIGMTRASDTEWQKGYWDGVDDMAEYIREQPAADVVPVVRCKDCDHLMISGCYGECSIGHLGIVRPDDFCSYGERKDGETP